MSLDQLREKAENATPGPWEHGREDLNLVVASSINDVILSSRFVRDAVFVAAFNQQVALALIDLVAIREGLPMRITGNEKLERLDECRRILGLVGDAA